MMWILIQDYYDPTTGAGYKIYQQAGTNKYRTKYDDGAIEEWEGA